MKIGQDYLGKVLGGVTMPDDEKKTPPPPKEEEPKPADPTKPPVKIIDITDQLPKGWGIMILED